jgi:hypothetical protein
MTKKLFRNSWVQVGLIFLIGLGVMVSPLGPKNRSAQDVAIAFALPMILFDTVVPYGIAWLLSFLKPTPEQQKLPFSAFPRRERIIAIALVVIIILLVVLLVAALALWLASFLYPLLGIDWAVQPARRLARWCFALGISPAILVIVYAAGILTARHSRNLAQLIQDQFLLLTSRALRVFRSGLT